MSRSHAHVCVGHVPSSAGSPIRARCADVPRVSPRSRSSPAHTGRSSLRRPSVAAAWFGSRPRPGTHRVSQASPRPLPCRRVVDPPRRLASSVHAHPLTALWVHALSRSVITRLNEVGAPRGGRAACRCRYIASPPGDVIGAPAHRAKFTAPHAARQPECVSPPSAAC